MADGSQRAFPFPRTPASRLRPGEIVVDLFAGGGGASTALEQAIGRPVDIAVNHNPWAVSMHAAMVGNSVSPPPLRAIAEANLDPAMLPVAAAA